MRTFFRETLITVILALVIFLLLQVTVQSFVVVGCSMEPTFYQGQRILVNKVAYNFHELERGDVIVFEPTNGGQADYIKRVIGVPGDTIAIKNEAVRVNGTKLQEPYIQDSSKYTFDQEKIAEDNYFVLGDNRNNSNDSHNGWTVPHENIVGKAWLSIWPPNAWGIISNYSIQEQVADAGSK
jgi:signal peptidase I